MSSWTQLLFSKVCFSIHTSLSHFFKHSEVSNTDHTTTFDHLHNFIIFDLYFEILTMGFATYSPISISRFVLPYARFYQTNIKYVLPRVKPVSDYKRATHAKSQITNFGVEMQLSVYGSHMSENIECAAARILRSLRIPK